MEEKKIDKTKIRFHILAILLIAIFCFAVSPVILQNDTFYTIKIGEHIAKHGIDMKDPFSYHGLKYTYPHWLYDLGIYLIYSIGGHPRNLYFNNYFIYYFRNQLILYECKIYKE